MRDASTTANSLIVIRVRLVISSSAHVSRRDAHREDVQLTEQRVDSLRRQIEQTHAERRRDADCRSTYSSPGDAAAAAAAAAAATPPLDVISSLYATDGETRRAGGRRAYTCSGLVGRTAV